MSKQGPFNDAGYSGHTGIQGAFENLSNLLTIPHTPHGLLLFGSRVHRAGAGATRSYL